MAKQCYKCEKFNLDELKCSSGLLHPGRKDTYCYEFKQKEDTGTKIDIPLLKSLSYDILKSGNEFARKLEEFHETFFHEDGDVQPEELEEIMKGDPELSDIAGQVAELEKRLGL